MARVRTGGTRTRWQVATAAVVFAGAAVTVACGPRRSEESFCEQLKVVRDLDEVLAGGSGPRTAERAGQLQELHLVAPETIEPQVGRLVAVTDDLTRTMGTAPNAHAAATEVFARRRAELPEITAAGKAVETYAAEHCQVDLNPTATTPPTTPAPATTAAPPASTTTRKPATTGKAPPTTRSTKATGTTRKPATTRKAVTTTRARATTTTTRRR